MSKSLAHSMLLGKCPKCRKGSMFPVAMMSYRKIIAINKSCSVCKASFQPEPSFYDGAMYISYAFSVALFISVFVGINILVSKPELWMYLTTIAILNLLLFPLMLRYSKVIYLYALGKLTYSGD